jgi:lipopolysaccharide/colanic/teichoic acid biosynthesis glycosyltransferase
VIKRLFDILFSLTMLLVLSPLMLGIALCIAFDSRGGIFFRQIRVGLGGKEFGLFKFRTMRPASESKGQLTVGMNDSRITKVGLVLRKYKIDELPQLLNILIGHMSVVGPRPEVPRYVNMYTAEQKRVLDVRPGLTDYASLEYFKENELLAQSADPEKTYIEEVMPAKLSLNMKYISQMGLATDIKIIWRTVLAIFGAR